MCTLSNLQIARRTWNCSRWPCFFRNPSIHAIWCPCTSGSLRRSPRIPTLKDWECWATWLSHNVPNWLLAFCTIWSRRDALCFEAGKHPNPVFTFVSLLKVHIDVYAKYIYIFIYIYIYIYSRIIHIESHHISRSIISYLDVLCLPLASLKVQIRMDLFKFQCTNLVSAGLAAQLLHINSHPEQSSPLAQGALPNIDAMCLRFSFVHSRDPKPEASHKVVLGGTVAFIAWLCFAGCWFKPSFTIVFLNLSLCWIVCSHSLQFRDSNLRYTGVGVNKMFVVLLIVLFIN